MRNGRRVICVRGDLKNEESGRVSDGRRLENAKGGASVREKSGGVGDASKKMSEIRDIGPIEKEY